MMPFGWTLAIVCVLMLAFTLAFVFGRMLGREQGYAEGIKEKEDLAQFALDEKDRVVALHDEAVKAAFNHGMGLALVSLPAQHNNT